MLGFLPTRAYRPGTPGATTFLSPLSGTFNYGWDSFVVPPELQGDLDRLDALGTPRDIVFEQGIGVVFGR